MERLTGRNKDNKVYYRHGAESGLQPYADYPPHECREAIERLAEYEDTGLTPEKIIKLNDFEQSQIAELLKENAELKEKCKDWEFEAKKWCARLGENKIKEEKQLG